MNYTFRKGDHVQILHTDKTGELVVINNNQATVKFDFVTLTLPLEQIKPASHTDITNKHSLSNSYRASNKNTLDMHKFVSFSPELDLHGLSIDEAIRVLDKWIDQALLAGHRYLRIIHGKGKGLLRQEVLAYLKHNEMVTRIVTNHNLPGGSGVTLIEL